MLRPYGHNRDRRIPPAFAKSNAIMRSMKLSLSAKAISEIIQHLADANARFQQHYPGGSVERQPVHSVYGGAQLFKAGGHLRLGSLALASLDTYASDAAT